ncbi:MULTISPECIES: bifunctional ADP-dependent NAD(P)H-hydrate dehydratase/NAD(P)H-hydrate epimerase [Streptomyces]|uniref:Bifunctional NAD(P)H-hydrate repair enzyme n=2 Tax=Streptomyces TaxID=1883 RepID=A0ABX3FSB0_9ACTN|nr:MULTISPECIES: bifunctional ADP-dependent NAD(P)H-hydrate dehydratase/NAD(P)H-hydrate epimerase [Streptomyces]OLZ48903.1 bifunctional ADP-dependent (S)-NAD(P)H-hydrate dehydratase/NAD(P)H-hydrate epimerase [Streptomyces amritsarensis]
MRTAYSVETVRAAERELMARLPEGALMQRAAAGLAAVCAGLLRRRRGRVYGARVVLLVGPGDNGGDALYAGARLARRGAAVTAVPMDPERMHAGGLAALRAAGGRAAGTLPQRADLVVDGLLGIGGRGGLRPAAAALVERIPPGVPVVAVDLPSGVDADTGEVAGPAVTAEVTVTFGAYKPGLLIDPGASRAGALHLVDIGLELPEPEVEALQHADVAGLLPEPTASSDKYRRGVVGIVAGSAQYPGAAVLAVAGALRGGAGAVRYVGPAADSVLARHPETLIGPGRVQAWVIGPGLGEGRAGEVADLLAQDTAVLVDADGLRGLDPAVLRARTAPTLLTPHAGEAAALLGVSRESVEAGRLAAVRRLAERYGAAVLLKGSTTLVASAGGRPVRVNPTGTPWLATAGSGDVLSGLAGSLLAGGLSGADAGAVGAYLHGLAARRTGGPLLAQQVAEALPAAWRDATHP